MRRFIAFVIFSSFAGSLVAQEPARRSSQDQPPPGAKDFIRGQEAVKRWDADGAIRHFERALDQNSDLILSYYYLGYAHQRKKDWDKAGENFEHFLWNVNDDDPKAHQLIFHATRQGGLALAQTAQYRRAVPYLQKTVQARPEDKEARFVLGVTLYRDQKPSAAEKQLKKVIELDADYGEAYYHLGRISNDKNEPEPARQHLEKFLELEPRSPHAAEAHFILGSLALEEAKAREHFEKVLELQPEGARAEEAKSYLEDLKEG